MKAVSFRMPRPGTKACEALSIRGSQTYGHIIYDIYESWLDILGGNFMLHVYIYIFTILGIIWESSLTNTFDPLGEVFQ
jgi:hypothetical protein